MELNTNNVLAVILGGGKGTRLHPLTKIRAKPAVPIGGKYRIIDIAISNCLHSKISRIFILTQFNTQSLHRHIYETYRFGAFSRGFVEILAAQQTAENMRWYQGTADSVRQNINFIQDYNPDFVIILSGDHLYRMDYLEFLKTHIKSDADVTISVKPVSRTEATGFGILQADKDGKIVRFIEKPSSEDVLEDIKSPGLPDETPYLASMGIYIFSKSVLYNVLKDIPSDDFGRDIIPAAISSYRVFAHFFEGYWQDIGTISAFFDANLQLTSFEPPFSFYDENTPFYTRPRFLPGSRLADCEIKNALICEGCFINKCCIKNSVIGIRTKIDSGTFVEKSIIMGADFYEMPEDSESSIPLGLGNNCVIKNAIIDKNARIGNNVKIVNSIGIQEEEKDLYSIRDGIVVIPKNSYIPDNTEI